MQPAETAPRAGVVGLGTEAAEESLVERGSGAMVCEYIRNGTQGRGCMSVKIAKTHVFIWFVLGGTHVHGGSMPFAYGGLDGGRGGDGEGDGEGGGEGGGWGQPRKALATPSPNAVSRPSDSL